MNAVGGVPFRVRARESELKHFELMLKFFRKRRRKLLTKSLLSKYMVYATGEIFLVMIGMLRV